MREEKIKKLRELFNVTIDEISLVKFPATRKRFAVIKSDDEQGIEKLIAAVADFVNDDFDIEKAADMEQFLTAIESLKTYDLENIPDEIKSCMDTIASFAVAGRGEAKEEEEDPDPDKGKKLKKADIWPSIILPDEAPFSVIEKKEAEPITIDDFDELDEINESQESKILKKIGRYIDRTTTPEDPFPSIYTITTKRPVPVIEKQEKPKNGKHGQKQSLSSYDEEIAIQKDSEIDDDPYPSIPNELFYRP